jgi:hypothetical protein
MLVFAESPAPPPPVDAQTDAPSVQFTSADEPEFGSSQSIFATKNGEPHVALAESIVSSIGGGMRVAASVDEADAVVDVVAQDEFDIYGPAGVVQVASGLSRQKAIASGTASSYSTDSRFLKTVLLNAPTLADLLSLDNPTSYLQIRMRAAGVPNVRSQSGSTRTIKVSANTKNYQLQYYQTGAPRTRRNSLQLEVISNQDCYLTLVSVNPMGDVYLLLPNAGQELSGFLSKGRITANTSVLIPDSLADDNVAGFHYDYSPPGGTDRVIAICFEKLADAEQLRAQLTKLELGGTLDAELFRVGTRGVTNITPSKAPDEPRPDQPTASQTTPAMQNPEPSASVGAHAGQSAGWGAVKLSLNVGID